MIDKHLECALLRQRGQNRPLIEEIKEKLSPQNKERLFRILQDLESDVDSYKRRARQPWIPNS